MGQVDMVRAWKDEDYRASLGEAGLALANPAGDVRVPDSALLGAEGFAGMRTNDTIWCCTVTTRRTPGVIGGFC
ncbi:mersacidin/lichenicidin family type 2 lantibiotic [Allokutzneria sp. A3M-2-11 16]|uniref:mersacidin/lichenicidin family type 2 lantibiotic n=1 Tax=Allokutzneria sp. A3M-2-11 16 TaxID=2962043 RepID=UPI0020B63A31|nr:mersacidin/lichenicidin family type 2 lantibiotic [Allokutzneria sp. A3M-2-11 16]MCP3801899.1 mersacidin/lichenicidin family type 2 lantibiotic [Allokutzneria sp. A3M-2-11 16]